MSHTPIHKRPVPDGFTTEWNKDIWNVGFVFQWSEVWECYLEKRPFRITVKPNQTLSEAYEARFEEPMFQATHENEVFFIDETDR